MMVKLTEDVCVLCEMIIEECKRERSREDIIKAFPQVPERVIDEVLDFLCKFDFLKKEGSKYKITEFGKKFLRFPLPEGGDEFDAN